jgi:hypothetical protein
LQEGQFALHRVEPVLWAAESVALVRICDVGGSANFRVCCSVADSRTPHRTHNSLFRSTPTEAAAAGLKVFEASIQAHIAITDQLVYRIHQIVEALIRDAGVLEFLGVTLNSVRQETLGSALLTLQLQVAETHELGHILHGHCEESAMFTPHIDSPGSASHSVDRFRAQAMEVDADGYVPHMLLKNLLHGGVGETLEAKLTPSKPIEDRIPDRVCLEENIVPIVCPASRSETKRLACTDRP